MSILNRIKRKLPVVGGSAPPPSSTPGVASARPQPAAPTWSPPEEEQESNVRAGRPVPEFLAEFVKSSPVVLFMKGSPNNPMCGFSANAAGILRNYDVAVASFDVLSDAAVRDGIKQFSQWPTIPQVYVGGEFIGGSDILMQMHQSGELREMIDQARSAQGA